MPGIIRDPDVPDCARSLVLFLILYYLRSFSLQAVLMLIATKRGVYSIKSDGTESEPHPLKTGVNVRRVAEGERISVVALEDGGVLALKDGDERRLETGIADRIDSLCIVNENPLDLLIGTTPPFLYRLVEEGLAQTGSPKPKGESAPVRRRPRPSRMHRRHRPQSLEQQKPRRQQKGMGRP